MWFDGTANATPKVERSTACTASLTSYHRCSAFLAACRSDEAKIPGWTFGSSTTIGASVRRSCPHFYTSGCDRASGSSPASFHDFPAVEPLADRAQKLPLGGWLNEGRLAVILQRKLPFRTRPDCGHWSVARGATPLRPKPGHSDTKSQILKAACRLCNLIIGCRWPGNGTVLWDAD